MTVSTTGGSGVTEYSVETNLGFEDVDAGDLQMPRLKIVGPSATFVDSMTQDEFSSLDVIVLGLVKGRTMWDKTVDEGDRPMCKSPDGENGFPNLSDQTPRSKRFPAARSTFDLTLFPAEQGINGHVTLPCASCNFKEWAKNEDGKPVPPPCGEQYIFPLLYKNPNDDTLNPAILTLKGSGIKPAKTYIGGFMRSRQPMFSCWTNMTLTPQSRGSVQYAVPVLRRGGATDQNEWSDWADLYRGTRDFLRQAPRPGDGSDSGTVASSNVNTGPATTPATATTAPSTPAVSPPAPEPAQTPAPATAPSTPAPAPTPVPEPAKPAATTTIDEDDDLPF